MAIPKPKPTTLGRYRFDARGRPLPPEREPAHRPEPSLQARTAIVTIRDADGLPVAATVNRRVSILEDERSHGRISEGAYQAGGSLARVFELASRIGSTSSPHGGSSLTGDQKASRMDERRCEAVDAIRAEEAKARLVVGEIGVRLLRRILGERMSYEDAAAKVGKAGAWGARWVATSFRMYLEAIADSQAAKGRYIK